MTTIPVADAHPDERVARALWSHLAPSSDRQAHALVTSLGPVGALDAILSDPEESPKYVERLREVAIDRVLRQCAQQGIRVVIPGDAEWPEALNDADPPPFALWVKGTMQPAGGRGMVAVVGARACTTYGAELAHTLAADLSAGGWSVVSGAAFGIDACAHRGSLSAEGHTVAVLAGGVDHAYPRAHAGLLEEITNHGAVVSESPPGATPTRYRFLHRNRLIAALGTGTVVVEAGLRSGARNTAGTAARLHRVVAAYPGSALSPSSAGCHQMIRDGLATLVTNAAEVLELLAPVGTDLAPCLVPEADLVTGEDRMVWDVLPLRAWTTAARVSATTALEVSAVSVSLARLHVLGVAERRGETWRKVT